MKTSLFDFHLPLERIATHPVEPRDTARLLRVTEAGIADQHIPDILDVLNPGDVLVLNNTKVIPARLYGKRGNAKVEILLHKASSKQPGVWSVFARPAKRLKVGQVIYFSEHFYASIIEKLPTGEVLLQFDFLDAKFFEQLEKYGEVPLPPYIERSEGALNSDKEDYQTCYAKKQGSVAAPTAGLHFTDALLEKLKAKDVQIVYVTLHVGGGTFLPVKVEDTDEHHMHSEYGEICERVAEIVNQAKVKGNQVISVGTTSLRLLESAVDKEGKLHPFCAETDIFITPGYEFKIVDKLLTNFHLPKSTLFMLVSAFSGRKRMLQAYEHAIKQAYRFYSYGDACLLDRCDDL